MAWSRAPKGLVDLFDAVLPEDPRVERRIVFSYPAAFVNGNMFAFLFQDDVCARLRPDERSALEAEHGPLPFEPMPGRVSSTYMRLPPSALDDEAEVAHLIAHAFRWTASLPPKVKRPRKTRAKSS